MVSESGPKQEPKVSIVLVVANQRRRSGQALQSALAQDGLEHAEILLVDSGSTKDGLPGSDHPRVRTILPPEGSHFGQMKAIGARQARAEIVAFMEDHVELRQGWLRGILESDGRSWSALGAEVHNANPGVGLSDALALINYGRWAPPMERGESAMLPGNNTIYRRSALLRYEDRLDMLLLSDTVLQFKLLEDGQKLWLEPAVSISHRNPTTVANGMKAEFHYHWCFGAIRSRVFGWSFSKRARYVVLSPVIPWLRGWRLVKMAWSRGHRAQGVLAKNLLPILMIMHSAALGEILGILFGLGRAGSRFTRFELNSPRPKPNELDA